MTFSITLSTYEKQKYYEVDTHFWYYERFDIQLRVNISKRCKVNIVLYKYYCIMICKIEMSICRNFFRYFHSFLSKRDYNKFVNVHKKNHLRHQKCKSCFKCYKWWATKQLKIFKIVFEAFSQSLLLHKYVWAKVVMKILMRPRTFSRLAV